MLTHPSSSMQTTNPCAGDNPVRSTSARQSQAVRRRGRDNVTRVGIVRTSAHRGQALEPLVGGGLALDTVSGKPTSEACGRWRERRAGSPQVAADAHSACLGELPRCGARSRPLPRNVRRWLRSDAKRARDGRAAAHFAWDERARVRVLRGAYVATLRGAKAMIAAPMSVTPPPIRSHRSGTLPSIRHIHRTATAM